MVIDQAPTRKQESIFNQIDKFSAHIVLPSTIDALTHLSEWTQAVVDEQGLSPRCAFRLELILVEAVTNIVEHAGADDADSVITVQVAVKSGYVVVLVEDSERDFDPTAAPEHRQPASLEEARIGGLGIHLIRTYTQQLEYRRIGNKNQLWMTLRCDD